MAHLLPLFSFYGLFVKFERDGKGESSNIHMDGIDKGSDKGTIHTHSTNPPHISLCSSFDRKVHLPRFRRLLWGSSSSTAPPSCQSSRPPCTLNFSCNIRPPSRFHRTRQLNLSYDYEVFTRNLNSCAFTEHRRPKVGPLPTSILPVPLEGLVTRSAHGRPPGQMRMSESIPKDPLFRDPILPLMYFFTPPGFPDPGTDVEGSPM